MEEIVMKLSIDEIKNPMNQSVSKKYHQYDNVEQIHIEKKNHHYLVQANVNVLGHHNKCTFEVDEKGQLESYQCSCSFCTKDSPCGHVGAVMLKINELDIRSFPYDYVSHKKQELEECEHQRVLAIRKEKLHQLSKLSRELILSSKDNYQIELVSSLDDNQYDLFPSFSIENRMVNVEYRIGNEKKYVLKNVTEFIERINNQEQYQYGKQLNFVHSMNNFTESGKKQIEFIKKAIALNDEKNKKRSYYEKFSLNRKIAIDSDLIDDFYELYKDMYHFGEIEDKIELLIEKEQDCYVIKYNINSALQCGDRHLYDFDLTNQQLIMNRMTMDNEGKAMRLINTIIDSDNELIVLEQNYRDFYKYVLLPVAQYFIFNENIDDSFNTYEDIKIYGDIDDLNQIYFQVVYEDENQNTVYGFQDHLLTNYQQDFVEGYIKKYADHIDNDNHKAYFQINNQKTYEFIFEGLETLKEYAQIYVSEGLKRIGRKVNYQLQVGVRIQNDLLEFDIESHDIPKDEIKDVLSHYRRKKKFYRLKDGDLLYLDSPDLEELSEFMDEYHIDTKDIQDGKFSMNKQRMLAIDEQKDDFEYIELDRKQSFVETLENFKSFNQKTYPIPTKYTNVLRDYQKEGYVWLQTLKDYGFNGILADDMGLGKTLQIITLLDSLQSQKPSLVICPSSLIYNWEDEVHKFSDTLKVTCITGNQDNRKSVITLMDYGLYVTSYDYMRRDYELYDQIEFEYVILDEAQYIKNQKTQNAKSVKSLNAKHKLALTGTPIENSLAELWSIFDFLMPQYLFNYHYFQNQYETDIVKRKDENKTKQLKRLVTPFILRRNKKDVLKELPDKIEQNMLLSFNEEEEKLYVANLAKVNEELQQLYDIEGSDKMQILKMLTRLRQICLEPRMVYDNIEYPSSKLKACLELLKTFKENNQKVLLFSSFTKVLDYIGDECHKAGISYYMLTGSTKKEERRELVSHFQKDKTTVFLISLKAGGTGLNLTAAEAVIHFDPWWNVSAQNQATDRAYRIGQNKNVQVFNLVMKDSIEEKILRLQKEKKELADAFVENNTGSLSQMSKEDIMNLFSL